MINEILITNDPLPHCPRQTRERRRLALAKMLEGGLTNAYATACANLVWTLRRAMLILSNSAGKQRACEIWNLNDLKSLASYWDAYVARRTLIPKLNDLLLDGFRRRSGIMESLDWKSEWQAKCRIVLQAQDDECPSLQECLANTPIIIEAADIVAEYVETKCKCKNVYKSYKSVKWLEEPPKEPEVVSDVISLE